MKLFLVEVVDKCKVDYDMYDGFVLRAKNKAGAKKACFRALGDEVKVTRLNHEGKEEIILGSFNAG